MKNILFILPDLDCGGAQRVILTLAKEMYLSGNKVTLVVFRKGGRLFDEVEDGIEIISFADHEVSGLHLGVLALKGMSLLLIKLKPDVIISSLTGANIVSIISTKLTKYNGALIVRHENTRIEKEGALKVFALKFLYQWADRIVTVSDEAREELAEKIPALLKRNKIKVINNPVDVKTIRNQACELTGIDWIDNKKFPVVMAVGRLEEQKDYPTLIFAFSKICRTSNIKLVILGEGRLLTSLKALTVKLCIDDQVHFIGGVTNPYAWMAKSDVYVMSSKWEGHPVALIEAMLIGANIVSTNCRSGPSEVLDNGRYGTLVPVADVDALARAIENALNGEVRDKVVDEKVREFSPPLAVESHLQGMFGA